MLSLLLGSGQVWCLSAFDLALGADCYTLHGCRTADGSGLDGGDCGDVVVTHVGAHVSD